MAQSYLTGRVDVSLYKVRIPSALISDDGVETTITEGTRDIATMAGTFTEVSGTLDEANSVFNVVLPNMSYLGVVFPDLYKASEHEEGVGQTTFGGNTCTARSHTPLVIHYSCDKNSDNDIFIPNASIVASVDLTQNASDPVVVEVTANALPSDDYDGAVAIMGTGSLSEKTLWNPITEVFEPVTES